MKFFGLVTQWFWVCISVYIEYGWVLHLEIIAPQAPVPPLWPPLDPLLWTMIDLSSSNELPPRDDGDEEHDGDGKHDGN